MKIGAFPGVCWDFPQLPLAVALTSYLAVPSLYHSPTDPDLNTTGQDGALKRAHLGAKDREIREVRWHQSSE